MLIASRSLGLRALRRALGICAVLACAAASAAGAPGRQDAPGQPPGFAIERSEDVIKIAPGARIEVTNYFGDVRARYGGGEDRLAMLRIVQQFADEGPPVEIEHETVGDALRIRVGVRPRAGGELELQPRPGQRKRAEVVLFVPEGRPLDIRTGSGFVQLRGLRSDATVRTGSGDMQIRSIRGSLDLATESGDLVVILESLGLTHEQRFRLGSGELELHLRDNGDYTVAARSRGSFATEYSLDMGPVGRDGARTARVALGEGTTPVRIEAGNGAIQILRKHSAESALAAPEQDA